MDVAALNPSNSRERANGTTGAIISAGQLDPTTKLPSARAVKDEQQAFSVYKRLEVDSRTRMDRNAVIARKLNGELPFKEKALENAGQSWRSNFSTMFLSGIVARALPPYLDSVESARSLTNSALPPTDDPDGSKSAAFQEIVTKTIREWAGFRPLMSQIANENLIFGAASAVVLDDIDWRPVFVRTDDALYPEGAKQQPGMQQLLVIRQDKLVHEFFRDAFFFGPDVAAQVGWHVDNVVEAINAAAPRSRENNLDPRRYEDLEREMGPAISYTEGTKVIELAHVIAAEIDGTVTHVIINRLNGKEIFWRNARWDSFTECLSIFTLEEGNSQLYGSKGLGRLLVNMHMSLDRTRNIMADTLYLSAMTLVKRTNSTRSRAIAQIQFPFCVLDQTADVQTQQFQANVAPFLQLESSVTGYAEQVAGAYIPAQLRGQKGETTATEAAIVAQRETQVQSGILARWIAQGFDMFSLMQRRMFTPLVVAEAVSIVQDIDSNSVRRVPPGVIQYYMLSGQPIPPNIVPDVKDGLVDPTALNSCIELLKRGLTGEDILILANIPAAQTGKDGTPEFNQRILALSDAAARNPLLAQFLDIAKLGKMSANAIAGNAVSSSVFKADSVDPSNHAEQLRQQQAESMILMTGEAVPVSNRDDDMTHLSDLMPRLAKLQPALDGALKSAQENGQPNELLPVMQAMVGHAEAHLQQGISKKMLDQEAVAQAQQVLAPFQHAFQQPPQVPASEVVQPLLGDPAGQPRGGGAGGIGQAAMSAAGSAAAPGGIPSLPAGVPSQVQRSATEVNQQGGGLPKPATIPR